MNYLLLLIFIVITNLGMYVICYFLVSRVDKKLNYFRVHQFYKTLLMIVSIILIGQQMLFVQDIHWITLMQLVVFLTKK